MFAQFLDIVFKSLKLDKTLYRTPRYYGEAGIYFAILIMILDGVAGAIAANTIVKTSVGISGLTALLTWLVWAIFIFVIGVKIFPDKDRKIPFKRVLIAVGYAHAPGFCCHTRTSSFNYFSYSILDFCFINHCNTTYFKFKIKFKSIWNCIFVFFNYFFFDNFICNDKN